VESESNKDTTDYKDNYDKVSQDATADILHDTKSIRLLIQEAIQEANDLNQEFQDVSNQENQKADDDEESNESKSSSDKEDKDPIH
jgi:flagellar hook-length control protein FliK